MSRVQVSGVQVSGVQVSRVQVSRMQVRVLAAAAAVWTAGFLVVYLGVVGAQDGDVAWWYAALLLLAALSLAGTVIDPRLHVALLVALLALAFAMLVGLLTIGALLAPAVVATVVALWSTRRRAPAPPESGQNAT